MGGLLVTILAGLFGHKLVGGPPWWHLLLEAWCGCWYNNFDLRKWLCENMEWNERKHIPKGIRCCCCWCKRKGIKQCIGGYIRSFHFRCLCQNCDIHAIEQDQVCVWQRLS